MVNKDAYINLMMASLAWLCNSEITAMYITMECYTSFTYGGNVLRDMTIFMFIQANPYVICLLQMAHRLAERSWLQDASGCFFYHSEI